MASSTFTDPQSFVSAVTTLSAAIWNRDVRDNIRFLRTPPGVSYYRNAVTALATGVTTKITWTTAREDTDAFFAGANPTRLTVPAGKAGRYLIGASVDYASTATAGDRDTRIILNGDATKILCRDRRAGSVTSSTGVMIGREWRLAAGDYIEVTAMQNSVASLDLTAGTATDAIRQDVWLHWMGA